MLSAQQSGLAGNRAGQAGPRTTLAGVTSVVIVEDDAQIRSALVRSLAERGYGARASATGLDGLTMIVDSRPDIVLLDLGSPDIDGAVSTMPVVVITARDTDEQVVRTLDAGADDYVVKPFSAAQLAARLRAVLRRSGPAEAEEALIVGALRIDPARRLATLRGRGLVLSRKEFDLLHALAVRQGRVVTKRQLLADVWEQPYGGPDNTVDVHLSWLRKKLGESASQPRYLRTVHGVGLRLVDPDCDGDSDHGMAASQRDHADAGEADDDGNGA